MSHANPPPSAYADAQSPEAQLLRRKMESFGQLNARIARLAMGLGLSLAQEADLQRVLAFQKPSVLHERRGQQADRRGGQRGGSSSDRRASHRWEELRGLVVMRYELETRLVADMGAGATHELMHAASAQLTREGFVDGADGAYLQRPSS